MNPAELAQQAAGWLKLPSGPDRVLEICAEAVVAVINQLDHVSATWDDATKLGAMMLTARLHRRRNSPSGVESLTEMGASYISRYDSDIARLLLIDAFAKPVAL